MRIEWQVFAGPYVCLDKPFRNRRGMDLVQDVVTYHTHRVQSLHRKRGRNSGLGVFSRRIAVVFASFAAILKKIFVGELRIFFFFK